VTGSLAYGAALGHALKEISFYYGETAWKGQTL